MKIPTPNTLEPLPAGTQPGKRVIQKKLQPPYFEQVRSGAKPFEIRLDDEDYRVGDTLLLREWENPLLPQVPNAGFTGKSVLALITSVVVISFSGGNTISAFIDGKRFWDETDVRHYGIAVLGLKLLAEVER